MVNFSPSALERLISQAKLTFPDTLYSNVYPFDPSTVTAVQDVLHLKPFSPINSAITSSPDHVAQFIVLLEGKAQLVTRPFCFIELDNGNQVATYLGSIGNIPGKPCPAKIPAQYFTSQFTSLIPVGVANRFKLPKLDQAPDTIPGPTVTNQDGSEEVTAPSMARLNFAAGDSDDEQPIIALLPTCLPLPIGVSFPHDGIPIDQDHPETNEIFPFFQVWQKAIAYALAHNGGNSVTEAGTLFQLTSIDRTKLAGHTIIESIKSPISLLLPATNLFKQVEKTIASFDRQIWTKVSENLPNTSNNGSPSSSTEGNQGGSTSPNPPVTWIKELASAFSNSIKESKGTMSEKEHLSQADHHIEAMSVICARLEPDPDTPGQLKVVPAKTTSLFDRMAKATSTAVAKSYLAEAVALAVKERDHTTDRIRSMFTFDSENIDSNFTAAIRTTKWMNTPYVRNPEKIKHYLSIVAFATPAASSIQFSKRIHAEETIQVQEQVNEHSNKMLKKATELFVGGKLNSDTAIKEMIANFFLIMHLLVDRFVDSELWKSMANYENHIRSTFGRSFFERFEAEKQIHLNVVADLQGILSGYTLLGTDARLRDAAAAGNPIDPVTYNEPNSQALLISSIFHSHVQLCSPTGRYDIIPVFAEYFPQLGLHKAKQDEAKESNTKSSGSESRTNQKQPSDRNNKHPRNETSTNATTQNESQQQLMEELKKKGFLEWTGQGDPPECPVRAKLQGMATKERMCIKFACRGSACRYGRRCHYAHVTHRNQLPPPDRPKLDDFVNATNGLSYAEPPPAGTQPTAVANT